MEAVEMTKTNNFDKLSELYATDHVKFLESRDYIIKNLIENLRQNSSGIEDLQNKIDLIRATNFNPIAAIEEITKLIIPRANALIALTEIMRNEYNMFEID